MTQENNQQIPDDYIPFGDEWKAYMMKLPKAKILDLYAQKGIESSRQSDEIKKLDRCYVDTHREMEKMGVEIERLKGAARELLDLHISEQEGLLSGKPTFDQWVKAVDKLSDALSPSIEQEGKEDEK